MRAIRQILKWFKWNKNSSLDKAALILELQQGCLSLLWLKYHMQDGIRLSTSILLGAALHGKTAMFVKCQSLRVLFINVHFPNLLLMNGIFQKGFSLLLLASVTRETNWSHQHIYVSNGVSCCKKTENLSSRIFVSIFYSSNCWKPWTLAIKTPINQTTTNIPVYHY